MSTMTLEQVRDVLEYVRSACYTLEDGSRVYCGDMADAIDAHLREREAHSAQEKASARVPDGWRDAMERALPFLDDEAAKYEDDGSNEPLDVVDTIRALLAAAPKPETEE